MATIAQWKEALERGALDEQLERLSPGHVARQRTRLARGLAGFAARWQEEGPVRLFSAPGRTELGGNHTDHQGGRVLCAAVDLDTLVIAAPAAGTAIELVSEGFSPCRVALSDLAPRPSERGSTAALLRGVAAGLQEGGASLGGARLYALSDVLPGSGLSSSAAFEMAVAAALNGLFCGGRTPLELAAIGQRAESGYFGKPCGMMDQVASAVGGIAQLDFAAPLHPAVSPLSCRWEDSGHRLCLVATGSSHADLTEDYAAIPREMGEVAAWFGQERLCQVEEEDLYANWAALTQELGERPVLRAAHFFREDRRAAQEAEALAQNDFHSFLRLARQSGRSSALYLQNLYSPTQPRSQPLTAALALCDRLLAGQGAYRVHGGGFGGTALVFLPGEMAAPFCSAMERALGPGCCRFLSIRPVGTVELSLPQ
ncbi:galactokinase [Bittarella massiliensis (ex Durand et al. 2017)]|uniref:galactokinase n=1 Tax=Bittarella massiliensis (ex Durand et al. 2017) TaxID=1720313 RepID=UPI001AA1178C|nr:galactokinase family protein [Bittarella massiliensis (ex Durand et al. 2017)]MBO1679632.1 galactokinase [Bittarella massiliensis (ex Durand et al. 2017)]